MNYLLRELENKKGTILPSEGAGSTNSAWFYYNTITTVTKREKNRKNSSPADSNLDISDLQVKAEGVTAQS